MPRLLSALLACALAAVPEPATLLLAALGLAVLSLRRSAA